MCSKDADGMVNSAGPDQTAHLGAVLPRAAMFVQTKYVSILKFFTVQDNTFLDRT